MPNSPAPQTLSQPAPTVPPRPEERRRAALELAGRLSALPEDPSRYDPQARPYRQRVRLELASACRELPRQPLRPAWERLAGRRWPESGPAVPGVGPAELAATVASPLRHEIVNPYAEHRLYPSPRSKFPVRVAVSDGSGRHLVVPELDSLVRLDGRGGPAALETASALAALPDFYGDLRPVLAGLETGHVLAALADTGRALGLPLTVAGPATGDWTDWPARRTGPVLPGFRLVPAEAGPAEADQGNCTAEEGSWAEVGWRRNSGRAPGGFYGFTARHGVLPPEALAAVLGEAARGPAGSGFLARWMPAVRVFCAVRAVTGLPDGLYEAPLGPEAAAAGPAALRRVGGLDALRGGLVLDSAPTAGLAYDLAGSNLVWVLAVDALRAVGPSDTAAATATATAGATATAAGVSDGEAPAAGAAFPGTLAAVGWLAQRICMGAAAAGLFARPLRSFHAGTVAAGIGAPDTLVPIYQVACGRNRFTEPAIDLRFHRSGASGGAR
ncbi:hypothetical protein ACIQBJ_16285 [Kitasatospora sp. NPDC088391]|uniref:hypothetical protein n=1 Tax=Kitasatospora sp. NPDC088391 TaxID=3364074 RepID=UPI0038120B37